MPLGVASSEEYLSLYSVNKVTMALLMQPERNADGSIALFKTRSPWNHAEAYERSQGCRVRFDRVASFIHRHPAAASTRPRHRSWLCTPSTFLGLEGV